MSDALPPRARAILELAQDAHDPSLADRQRVHERVMITLAATVAGSAAAGTAQAAISSLGTAATAGSAGGATSLAGGAAAGGVGLTGAGVAAGGTAVGGASLAGAGAALSVGISKVVGMVSIAVLMAGGTAVVVKQRLEVAAPASLEAKPNAPSEFGAPSQLTAPNERSAQATASAATAAVDLPTAPEVVAARAAVASAPTKPAKNSEPRLDEASANVPAREAPSNALTRELALLRVASAALQRGDSAFALERLNEHEKAFPSGSLSAEREGLRAIAACRLGGADAKSAAQRLLANSSGTVLATRIRKACGIE